MKKTLLALAVISFVSCTKNSTEEVPIDPTKPYTIKYNLSDQTVKTRVSNDTLFLDYYQKIDLLVDPDEYTRSWALYVKQDLSNSYLKNLHYRLLANSTGYVSDWYPISFNDVRPDQITTVDTTVDGKKYTKVTLQRVFMFSNRLASNQAAVDKQNELIQNKTDTITFEAFYGYNSVYSLGNDANQKIVYTK